MTVATLEREVGDAVVRAQVPAEVLREPVVSERMLRDLGVPVRTAEVVSLGGGMGSFAFLDLLRNSGMSANQLVAVGPERVPYGKLQRLCENSQLGPADRMRSNSDSCPDNLWGFPGYAVREIGDSLRHGRVLNAMSVGRKIFAEPTFAETYTPRSGQVFRALDREAQRIGWERMLEQGWIRAVRKTDEGRLMTLVTGYDAQGERWERVVMGRVLHLAVGYPAVKLLPELVRFREMYGYEHRVVNAYEEHEHVYRQLRAEGGVVLLRGRGIVGSRIIERLAQLRTEQPRIEVIHLHRSRIKRGHIFGMSSRRTEFDFEFQPFNWPKAAWTGEHRELLESAKDEERRALLDAWGGTTTARRRQWLRVVRRGLKDGWYRPEYGIAESVAVGSNGRIVTHVGGCEPGDPGRQLETDFVIDCTGMESAPATSSFLADLVETYAIGEGPVGRLRVSDAFEVEDLRHGDARCYAAGAMTLGGPQAAVDSFLGLQYAAMASVADMQGLGLPGLRKLNGLRSVRQWTKWARGVAP